MIATKYLISDLHKVLDEALAFGFEIVQLPPEQVADDLPEYDSSFTGCDSAALAKDIEAWQRAHPAFIEVVYDEMRHLACLPYSKENLHKIAAIVGIKRCWFHKDHYDIPKGQIEKINSNIWFTRKISPKEMVKICRH